MFSRFFLRKQAQEKVSGIRALIRNVESFDCTVCTEYFTAEQICRKWLGEDHPGVFGKIFAVFIV